MAIYLLKRIGHTRYDEYSAKIVRATSKERAAEIANINVGDEGHIWENKTLVSCERVGQTGKSEEILADFNAG
jgi:hypothetical protein